MKPASASYVELQVSSNFSFLRGASHPEELIRQAHALGYKAIALTDRHSLAGIVRAHVAAKSLDISLIVGSAIPLYHSIPEKNVDALSPEESIEAKCNQFRAFTLPLSLLLFPSSKSAYGKLCSLLSRGKLRAPKGQCFITLSDLRNLNQGLLAVAVVHDLSHPNVLSSLHKLKTLFSSDRLSLAISLTYGPDSQRRVESLSQLSQLVKVPLVATNDVHYHSGERRILQDVLTCVRHGCTLEQAGLRLFQNAERTLKTPEEIARLFSEFPSALRRSVEIAQIACQFSLDQLRYQYPREICPKEKSPMDYLKELVRKGCRERYPEGTPLKVVEQIKHELCLIEELEYPKYFLTVYDIISFARERKILCQGRGAAANSAVCYVLGITAVDPSRINLLFERFISKERNEPPDIDIDFEHERREEVIQHIYSKYGRHRAALVAAVITYRTRSAVRDVGKVFALSEETIEKIIKLLTRNDQPQINETDIQKRELDPKDRSIYLTIEVAQKLRGFPRHLSQHVGGFIVSEKPLSEIVPIENAAMPGRTIIEWDKDDIDAMGMLKIDILALGMLSAIRKAFSLVNAKLPEPGTKLSLHSIPPEDKSVYDMLCQADSIGVFQIESRAQMSMLPRLRPRCFYDLVIEVAIVRPGPIQGGMVHPYLRRRSGKEAVRYPSREIKKVLAPTLGVPIFQEQVMEIAVVAAGFSPGEADELRRAMASWKKSKNLISGFGRKLIEGMLKNGYSKPFAKQIFEQIQGFGEYGFPQSHAASFALLVYVSAWLKKHHPCAFTAALLNSQPMGFYRPAQLIQDAKNHGVKVLSIDVMFSDIDCTLENSPPALRLGMRLVHGLNSEEAKKIVSTLRKNGPYKSLTKLWRESGARVSSLKQLARADAFNSLGLNRQQALWEIKKLRDSPLPLFEDIENNANEAAKKPNIETQTLLPPVSPEAQVMKDYQASGLSLKAHPISFFRRELTKRGIITAWDLKENSDFLHGSHTAVCGMVLVRQRPRTASGVVFMTIEDETGLSNLIIKARVFKEYQDIIRDSVFILALGRIQRVDNVVHLLAQSFEDLSSTFLLGDSMSRDFR